MSVKVECCPVPVDGVLVDIATNSDQTLLATVTSASSDWHTVRVWAAAQSDFTNIATWTTKDAVHHITWAQPEFGPLLAGATESGTVHIWHQEPASTSGSVAEEQNKHEIKYKLGCSLSHAGKGISCLRFAPARHGLLLAVGTNEAVFVYEADRPLAPDVWTLQSRIDVPGGARSISWRPFSMCVPPMLLLGGAQGASVWMYSLPLMAWQHACQLPLKAAPGGVTSVHWAPNLSGGSQELLAIAYGRSVAVAALAPAAAGAPGDVGAAAADPVTPPLRAEVLAALDHGADVWRVEWNLTGNCVAAATDDARVCLWKADLVGAWRMHAVVQGEPEPVGMNDDGMAVA